MQTMQGWLRKRGGGHWSSEFRSRWFVLNGYSQVVQYFKAQPASPADKPSGEIRVQDAAIVSKGGLGFEIHVVQSNSNTQDSRVFIIEATSTALRDEWVEALERCQPGWKMSSHGQLEPSNRRTDPPDAAAASRPRTITQAMGVPHAHPGGPVTLPPPPPDDDSARSQKGGGAADALHSVPHARAAALPPAPPSSALPPAVIAVVAAAPKPAAAGAAAAGTAAAGAAAGAPAAKPAAGAAAAGAAAVAAPTAGEKPALSALEKRVAEKQAQRWEATLKAEEAEAARRESEVEESGGGECVADRRREPRCCAHPAWALPLLLPLLLPRLTTTTLTRLPPAAAAVTAARELPLFTRRRCFDSRATAAGAASGKSREPPPNLTGFERALWAAFTLADRDGNGSLSRWEFTQALKAAGAVENDVEARKEWLAADQDGSNAIDWDEFLRLGRRRKALAVLAERFGASANEVEKAALKIQRQMSSRKTVRGCSRAARPLLGRRSATARPPLDRRSLSQSPLEPAALLRHLPACSHLARSCVSPPPSRASCSPACRAHARRSCSCPRRAGSGCSRHTRATASSEHHPRRTS